MIYAITPGAGGWRCVESEADLLPGEVAQQDRPLPVQEPVPSPVILRRQLRRAMYRTDLAPGNNAGDAVAALVAEIGGDLKIWWEDGPLYDRHDPIVLAVIDLIGATPAQADAMWALGATL